VKGVSPVVPVVEASFNLCPVLPVNGLLEDKTKVHVAGVPLSSVEADCRLVVGPSGCDDVGVERHKLCFFIRFWRANESLALVYGTSSPAWKWKRGPLAPVVVGEGQVNLVYGRRL